MGSVFSRLNRAHADSPGQGGAGRQPRTSALVLEYWSRHPRSPEGGRVGSESYRPTGRRSAQSISRNDRLLPPQSQVYEDVRRGMAGRANCAAGCCTNSLVPQLRHFGQREEPRRTRVVYPGHHPKRLEPNVLVHQIESGLYRRQGKALTNPQLRDYKLPRFVGEGKWSCGRRGGR